ncbi:MAG TPA: DUF4457 domain-containing protein [Verrucomicrobiales bacterium]|nr:DUF4457 domain-containing protein [Verrucomicrobiales bacterium]
MNARFPVFTACSVMALVAASAMPAQSAIISGVSINSVSSELGLPSFDRAAVHLLDGIGFDEVNGFHTNAPDGGGGGTNPGSMWLTNGVFRAPNDPLPAFVVFDLGGNYDLNSFKVWNYNETRLAALTGRGANQVQISVSGSAAGPFTSLGDFFFNQATGSETTDFGQVINLAPFAAADNTRLIRFDILTNHGGDNSFAGLSEVRFDGTAVPEVSVAGLLGLAMGGVMLRRRRVG